MDGKDLEQLTQRLARLESFNRRLSSAVVLLVIVLASVAWMGQIPVPQTPPAKTPAKTPQRKAAPTLPKVIEAQQFVMRTEGGKVLATLAVTDGGPTLRLVGPNGTDRAILGLDAMGTPRLTMARSDGSQPLTMALSADGTPRVEVVGPDKSKAQLTIGREGPSIGILDAAGTKRAGLDLIADGPVVTLVGKGKNVLAAITGTETGPTLALSDTDGHQRITMIVVNQQAVFGIRDARGDVRVGLEVKAENPALGLYGPNGKALFVKP